MLHEVPGIEPGARDCTSKWPATMLHLVIDLTRASRTDDPYGFYFGSADYIVQVSCSSGSRIHTGRSKTIRVEWSTLLPELEALSGSDDASRLRQRIGDHLRALLGQAGWSAHEIRIDNALHRDDAPIHVTIRANAAELYLLPWELVTLEAQGQHLGELDRVVIGYAWPDTRSFTNEKLAHQQRALFAWSASGGSVPATAHQDALYSASRSGAFQFDLDCDVLANVSMDRIDRKLSDAREEGRPITMLHLLCHGRTTPAGVGLDWHGRGSRKASISAADLRRVLNNYVGDLQVLTLCACHSADHGAPGHHLGSVAQELHRIGIPWVIGSRHRFQAESSVYFAEAFFGCLARGTGSIEEAFSRARRRLLLNAGCSDWTSLQLYARAEDRGLTSETANSPPGGRAANAPLDARAHADHRGLKVAAALDHRDGLELVQPQVHDVGSADNRCRYIEKEYLEGEDLSQVLRKHGPPAAGEAVDIELPKPSMNVAPARRARLSLVVLVPVLAVIAVVGLFLARSVPGTSSGSADNLSMKTEDAGVTASDAPSTSMDATHPASGGAPDIVEVVKTGRARALSHGSELASPSLDHRESARAPSRSGGQEKRKERRVQTDTRTAAEASTGATKGAHTDKYVSQKSAAPSDAWLFIALSPSNDLPDLTVAVDGKILDRSELGKRLAVSSGTVAIRISSPGYWPTTRHVDTTSGRQSEFSIPRLNRK